MRRRIREALPLGDVAPLPRQLVITLCSMIKKRRVYPLCTRAQQLLRWGPFGHNRRGPKSGGASVPLSVGELGLHLTQCRLGRGLPPYQVAT